VVFDRIKQIFESNADKGDFTVNLFEAVNYCLLLTFYVIQKCIVFFEFGKKTEEVFLQEIKHYCDNSQLFHGPDHFVSWLLKRHLISSSSLNPCFLKFLCTH
jgi:hypothetical protein